MDKLLTTFFQNHCAAMGLNGIKTQYHPKNVSKIVTFGVFTNK